RAPPATRAALGEEPAQVVQGQGVEDPVGGGPAAAGGGHGEAHVGQVAGAVAVGAEGQRDPELVGEADLLVAQVEAVRGAVDLQGGAGGGGPPAPGLPAGGGGGCGGARAGYGRGRGRRRGSGRLLVGDRGARHVGDVVAAVAAQQE